MPRAETKIFMAPATPLAIAELSHARGIRTRIMPIERLLHAADETTEITYWPVSPATSWWRRWWIILVAASIVLALCAYGLFASLRESPPSRGLRTGSALAQRRQRPLPNRPPSFVA